MNTSSGWARRYHWLSETVKDFVSEPHQAVQNLAKQDSVSDRLAARKSMLNMVAHEADANRNNCAELARQNPDWVVAEPAAEPS